MKRKIAIIFSICVAFIGVFCGIVIVGKSANAYVANKSACAAIYWTGKQTHYSVDSNKQKTKETELKSSKLKANAAARVKICTTKVNKDGVITGSLKATYINPTATENKKTKTIKLFKGCNTETGRVVCQKQHGNVLESKIIAASYTKGKTNFRDFVIDFAGQFKQSMSKETISNTSTVGGAPVFTKVVVGGKQGLLKGYKYDFVLQDTIYWDPDMSKEGTDKSAKTNLSGGEWTGGNPDDSSSDSSGKSDDADPCYSGAGVLGHVLCPILKNFGELADSAYVNWIQPNLIIEPELLSDDENGTFAGWQIFQNFANIAFIIMLLVVVLSQVTGVGLSNYGIKKTLPKLIVAAVLINISYIICQLAVDLSNVLGVGLKSLMDGLTEQLQTNLTVNEVVFNADAKTGVSGWQVGDTVAALAILAGIIAGTGTLLAQGMAVLLPLLLGAIAVAIGILFFFFLLSVRKAGVVLLVVLSPIAFVCYMLPNTKKLFDRWIKAFSGLLLLFPICGLIIGGGDFASTVLLNVNASDDGKIDFFFALTAMIVGIAPVFFIPLLLRNSMSALGSIGDRISKRGSAINDRINKRIRGSDAYNSTRARWAAGRDGGLRSRIASSRVGRHLPGSAQLARNRAAYAGMIRQQSAQGRALQSDYLSGTREDIEAEEFKAELQARENAISNSSEFNDLGALQKGLETALKRGDKMGIRAYQNVLSSKGENGRDAVHDAMVNAQRSGSVSAEAAQTYAANIMNNHAADYKNSNRSTFDYANSVQNLNKETRAENVPKMTDFSAISAGSLKAENLPGTDDGELGRYITALENGKISEADAADLRAITNEALSNENIRGSIKGKQLRRIERINHLAGLRTGEIAGPPEPPPPSPLEGDTGPLH